MKKRIAFVAPVNWWWPYELYKNLVKELNDTYEDIECLFVSWFNPWLKLHINRDKYEIIISSIPFLWKPIWSKYILNINGLYWKERSFSPGGLLAFLFPYNSLFANKILYSSKFLKNMTWDTNNKSQVIYPFVKNQISSPQSKNSYLKSRSQINIVTVTSFAFWDKARWVLDIIDKLQALETDTQISLTIVWGGKYLEKIQKESQRYVLWSNIEITFVGSVLKEEINDFYLQSDIFLYSTFQDTFGIAILEAMSYGLPVILNDYKLFDEIFDPIHIVKQKWDFSTLFQRIIYDEKFYEKIKNIWLKTENLYSIDTVIPQWYKEIIE